MANLPKLNKISELNNVNFTKAREVVEALLALFKLPTLPAPLVSKRVCLSASLRSGLSAKKIAAEIIKNQGEAGALIGPNDDGTDNISEKMEYIRVKAIIDALLTDARVTITSLPGTRVVVTGVTPPGGGPVTAYGNSVNTGTGYGTLS